MTTVAIPTFGKSGTLLSRSIALIALAALVAGPLVVTRSTSAGRWVGIWGFVGASCLCWVLLGDAIEIGRLEPVRAALGALAWGLFGLGWGAVRDVGHVPEKNPRALGDRDLKPRSQLPPGAVFVVALSVLGALMPLLLAWRVTRPEHAILAHGAALLAAIATLGVGARVAIERGRWKPAGPPAARLNRASVSLSLLAVTAVVGLVYSML